MRPSFRMGRYRSGLGTKNFLPANPKAKPRS
jgi:hypothetical protein